MHRYLLAGIAVLCSLALGASPGRAAGADGRQPPRVSYRGYVTSSASHSACYAARGIFVGLEATNSGPRVSLARLRAVANANRPTRATLTVAGRVYKLRVDASSSGYAFRQIWWNFAAVRVGARVARTVVGKRATLAYTVRSKHETKAVKVAADPC